jgi:hypothetical protein
VVSGLGGIMLFFLVLLIPTTMFGGGSFLGFGESSACVDTPAQVATGALPPVHVSGLSAGTHATVRSLELCSYHATREQLVLQIGTELPEFVFFLVVLGAIWLALRTARRRGLFSPHVALQVLRLGTLLFIGSLGSRAIEAAASARLAGTMVTSAHSGFFTFFDIPWTLVIISFATLTVGRTLAQAVRMQREIDATV